MEPARTATTTENRLLTAPVRPILVPMALGAVRAGVELGAEELDTALRARFQRRGYPELAARLRASRTVAVPPLPPDHERERPGGALFLKEILAASHDIADAVQTAVAAGELALILGGDHALSIGSVAGAARATGRLGILWIDAHGDINTPETSPSGRVHGMPLAAALGRGPAEVLAFAGTAPEVRPSDTFLVGVRDLDPGERAWLLSDSMVYLSMSMIDTAGFEPTLHWLVERLRRAPVDALHVSFDVDALDPLLLPGTGTRAWGGFSFREAARFLRMLRAADLPIHSLDWVELNPSLDPTGASTAIATELLAIALGEETV